MGPTRGRQDPGGPHVGPMTLAFWVKMLFSMKIFSAELTTGHYLKYRCPSLLTHICGTRSLEVRDIGLSKSAIAYEITGL